MVAGKSIRADEPESARLPRRPSARYAIPVIAGLALLTASAIAIFCIEPSQSSPEKALSIGVNQPVQSTFFVLPARKVATTPVRVAVRRVAQPFQADGTMEDSETPEQQDPRWARSDSEGSEADVATIMQPHAWATQNGVEAPDATVLFDPEMETAAIETDQANAMRAPETKPARPVAEAPVDDEMLPPSFTSTRTVQINRGVNMRSRPESGSSVLTVVPKAASVKLVGCKLWCEVFYKGRRGYVFKDFAFGNVRAPTKTMSAKDTAGETSTVSTSRVATRQALSQPPTVKVISPRVQ